MINIKPIVDIRKKKVVRFIFRDTVSFYQQDQNWKWFGESPSHHLILVAYWYLFSSNNRIIWARKGKGTKLSLPAFLNGKNIPIEINIENIEAIFLETGFFEVIKLQTAISLLIIEPLLT